jgi:hypothetical protein
MSAALARIYAEASIDEGFDDVARQLGRRALMQVAGIVTPDTILRWYQRLIAQQYDGSPQRRRGRR